MKNFANGRLYSAEESWGHRLSKAFYRTKIRVKGGDIWHLKKKTFFLYHVE